MDIVGRSMVTITRERYDFYVAEIERLRQRVELLEGHLNGALDLVENFTHCDTTDARRALEEKD